MTPVHLLTTSLEHFGLIALATFVLLLWCGFRKLILKETSLLDNHIFIPFSGAFDFVSTYVVTVLMHAIAILRTSWILAGGPLCGPPLEAAGALGKVARSG